MSNISTIKEIQCSNSHICLCIINKTILGVLLNEKYGLALVDYIKKGNYAKNNCRQRYRH